MVSVRVCKSNVVFVCLGLHPGVCLSLMSSCITIAATASLMMQLQSHDRNMRPFVQLFLHSHGKTLKGCGPTRRDVTGSFWGYSCLSCFFSCCVLIKMQQQPWLYNPRGSYALIQDRRGALVRCGGTKRHDIIKLAEPCWSCCRRLLLSCFVNYTLDLILRRRTNVFWRCLWLYDVRRYSIRASFIF